MGRLPRLWIGVSHHAAFRCGGWAWVRERQGQVTGEAGGERGATAARMALTGLTRALRDLAADGGVVLIQTTSLELAAAPAILAGSAEAPSEDLDLWARLMTAAKGLDLKVTRVAARPGDPIEFAAAWADLAMDKAKATGAFTAAIPRPNLLKLSGLAAN